MTQDSIEVLIADSHPLCREGLTNLFARNLGSGNVLEVCDFPSLMSKLAVRGTIDHVTIDIELPGLRKREGLRDLRIQYPGVRVVVVTASLERDAVLDALGVGVHGYITKDYPVSEMVDALRRVLAGQIYVPPFLSDLKVRNSMESSEEGCGDAAMLTGRQLEVLNLLAAGRSNKEIARLLRIAEGTVKVHIAAAFRMLGVHNRVSAVAMMQARSLNGDAAEAYLPGLLRDRRARPMSRRTFSEPSRISYTR